MAIYEYIKPKLNVIFQFIQPTKSKKLLLSLLVQIQPTVQRHALGLVH